MPVRTENVKKKVHFKKYLYFKCPFLIIHGEKDSAITIDKAEALSKRVPNLYKFLRIKDGPHGPNMTHVQETNDAIIDFMENI